MTYKSDVASMKALFERIAAYGKLYIPVDIGNSISRYEEWDTDKQLSIALNTVGGVKDFFFPQTQDLVDFRIEGKSIEIIDNRCESDDFVVFGMRACDVRSLDVLDRVFLSEPIDTYYETRRKHATLISLVCNRPEETCFCNTFGIDAVKPGGDVRCTIIDDVLYLETLTEKGERLIESVSDLLYETDNQEIESNAKKIYELMSRLPLYGLKAVDYTDKQLEVFNSSKWAKLSEPCIGCGTCTFVCPTCQCYDIRDYNTNEGVKRFRCWDSCMYSEFTRMAGGNPRHTQLEKFRQRFMHKLCYFPSNNDGMYGCVGCGRCLRKCPISMNIVKVMKALESDKETETDE